MKQKIELLTNLLVRWNEMRKIILMLFGLAFVAVLMLWLAWMLGVDPKFAENVELVSWGLSLIDDLVIRVIGILVLIVAGFAVLLSLLPKETANFKTLREEQTRLLYHLKLGSVMAVSGVGLFGAYELDKLDKGQFTWPPVLQAKQNATQVGKIGQQPSASAPLPKGANSGHGYGGPYPLGGTRSENDLYANSEKIAEFGFLYGKRLFYSEGVKLSKPLFCHSIGKNKIASNGKEYQRYNYVISTSNGIPSGIWVAQWKGEGISEKLKPVICKSDDCKPSDCKPTAYYKDRKDGYDWAPQKTMINVFPELPTVSQTELNSGKIYEKESPCFFKKDWGAADVGILDASSKHFMIAQGGYSIENYDPKSWSKVKVLYAGELLVDVQKRTYSINTNSGTFQPWPGEFKSEGSAFRNLYPSSDSEKFFDSKYLENVAKLFSKTLDSPPNKVQYLDRSMVDYYEISEGKRKDDKFECPS